MKTYTLEELEKSQKTRLDYEQEHQKMIATLRAQSPANEVDKENTLWPGLPFPYWTDDNLSNEEIPTVTEVGASNFGTTGTGLVQKLSGQE